MDQKKILFVDDDQFIQKIYVDRLTASGFKVFPALTVSDATNIFESEAIDLVCLDYLLGNQRGIDVLNWIRQEKKSQVPVIIFSASGQDQDIADFMKAGATEYVQKDHTKPTELVEKMNKYLAK